MSAAISHHQAGDLKSAAAQYRAVLAIAPDHAEALYLAGDVDRQAGSADEALRKLEKSLALRPNHLPALEMLGAVAVQAGKFGQAADSFGTAAALRATPDAHYNHGFALFKGQRYDAAVAAFRAALALKADFAQAHYLMAASLRLLGRLEEAAAAYERVIALRPQHAHAMDEYGGVLFDLGLVTEAETVLRRAIAVAPDMANPYTNLGRIYHHSCAVDAASIALELHDQAIARAPANAEAHNNRAVALQMLGRTSEALASYEKAIALKPAYAEAHRNKGLASLMLQRWSDGWTENEWRYKCRQFPSSPRGFSQPVWDGTPPIGTLLVWGEQGIGDEILYGSMVGDLVEQGYSIAWEMDDRLRPLVTRSFPRVQAIARRTPPAPATSAPSIAAQISTASLGQYLRTAPGAFPANPRRYLRADEARTAVYRDRLTRGGKTRVIGISWTSANPRFGAHKSSPLELWRPLWNAADSATRFVDLQYGDTATERARTGLDLTHCDDVDVFADMDGLAALIAACDGVVSVSNTTAHLACALGVPTAVIVPFGNGQLWYWGNDGAHTPWYPSARVFRQHEAGHWEDVLAAVAKEFVAAS
ncbi:MAG: tetratricopeptide repeat protein [Rhodospirillaceae bacterium]|nr:tetratricopeptide repeat protein [Rhodospirillaceae bacterium]